MSSTLVIYCTEATEGSPMDGWDGMTTLKDSRLSLGLHSCPVPWGYALHPKALVADGDYHVTVTAHFPVNIMTTLEWGYGAVRLRGLWGGSVVTSVSAALLSRVLLDSE